MAERPDLGVSTHLEGLRAATVALTTSADAVAASASGLKAAVSTCPEWSLRRLLAHQGAVHRWARGSLAGERIDIADAEQAGIDADDIVEWLRDGAIELVTQLASGDADPDALVFLRDAGGPLEFWARRQCHETTIHAVDAVLTRRAVEGAATTLDDELGWITPEIAVDGIDELLTGFLPRSRSTLRSATPLRILVTPTDPRLPPAMAGAWVVEVGEQPPATARTRAAELEPAPGDLVVSGTAREVYLTLWNRSDAAAPRQGWELWRDLVTIG